MFRFTQYSSAGPYTSNEDSYKVALLDDGRVIACVADGVGGESRGEFASTFSTNKFVSSLQESFNEDLTELVRGISMELVEQALSKGLPSNVYTTFTGVHIFPDGQLDGVHVGDSRALILRDNGILQLTEDHTEAQRFLREGKISKAEIKDYPRKNVLESAIGMNPLPHIQRLEFKTVLHDRILLMSDGVYGKVSKRLLRDLSVSSENIEELIKRIVDQVESSTPDDNFTVLGIEIC